ncbi:tetracycline resistance efflux system leader peptide [Bacillus subtilis]|nr:tetracycline resistance efflux system leader peptide [Bacillus subtilis]MCB7459975.1 tetracycline resistance efflux system leader peptide [Bacillus subtilis]UEG59537.1 tetracycline resistance efflux system leader peptide [Bacillus sp. BC1-43]
MNRVQLKEGSVSMTL